MTAGRRSVPLRFEPRMEEEAVFRAIHSGQVNRRLASRILAQRDRAYDLPAGEDRDAAFRAISTEAFRGVGLDRLFRETLDELPALSALVELRVMLAHSPADEHAELFVRDGADPESRTRRGVVWILIKRFLEPDKTREFLRRELLHLSDMLDDGFGYRPDAVPAGRSPAQRHLFRDRYRLLWEITAAGRLERRQGLPAGSLQALRPVFDTVFRMLEPCRREEVFRRLGTDDRPTHALLVEIVESASAGTRDEGRPDSFTDGGVCSVCGFSTFDWAEDPASIDRDVVEIVREMVPAWRPEHGICRRCHEVCRHRALDSKVETEVSS